MRGNITRRGKSSWRIKFDIGVDADGNRLIQYQTIVGSKKAAQETLARRLAEVADGKLVRRSSETFADYARHWLATIAPANTSGKTRERYGELIEKQILPRIGSVELQKLDGQQIDTLYATLGTSRRRDGKGGLSPQTVRHVHRLLSLILASAVKAKRLGVSPMVAVQTAPKVRRPDIQVLDDCEIAALFAHLNGRPLYMPVLLAASTGMRRGEVLGLRWKDLNLDKATLQGHGGVGMTRPGRDHMHRHTASK